MAIRPRRASKARAPYTYAFGTTENPISDGGLWLSRHTARTRVRTSGGLAFGTQGSGGGFDDSYAYVPRGFGPDQEIETTFSRTGSLDGQRECEHLLWVRDGEGHARYYEFNVIYDGSYFNLYRAEGGVLLADYTQLATFGTVGAILDGYKMRSRATMNGSGHCVLTTWLNRIGTNGDGFVQIGTFTDTSALPPGGMGIGFFRDANGTSTMDQFCWTDVVMRNYP